MKLSVIVPTFNRRATLELTLPLLAAQDLAAEEYEVIIVMDGSTDGTAELLREWTPPCSFKVVEAEHRGPGAARNAGIEAAAGDLILFLDDDLMVGPDLFRRHCEAHDGSEVCVVHGPIYVAPDSSPTIIRYVIEKFYEDHYRPLDPNMVLRYPDGIGGSTSVLSSLVNSSMPREILLSCGGFDEEILAAEDLELGLRLWKLGVYFRYLPSAVAHEHFEKSSANYLKGQARALGAGDLRTSRKHPEYRPYSALSTLAETRPGKRWLRNALLRSPVSLASVLAVPLRLERQLYRFALARRIGVRLIRMADRIVRMRSGLGAAGSWDALESEFGRTCPVLLYHHVGPLRPNTHASLTVSPKLFEQQIRWLVRRGCVGIRPADWLRWVREGKGLPEKPIIITFDDGYADIAEFALPVLRKYGFGAAVYVVTSQFGGTNTWDEAQGCGTLQLLTADQIRTWAGEGIEFGAHSRTHPNLTTLSPGECEAEISGSRQDLAEVLGASVGSFAYPFGELNAAVCDVVRREFDIAFSTVEGNNYLSGNLHLLRRIYVGPDDSRFWLALSLYRGGLKPFRDLRVKIGLRTRLRRLIRQLTGGS